MPTANLDRELSTRNHGGSPELLHTPNAHDDRVVDSGGEAQHLPHFQRQHPAQTQAHAPELGHDFYRVIVHYGFKDEPDLPEALATACRNGGMEFNMMETSFFLSRQTLVPTPAPGMALWRERLFATMSRNAASATAFFKIPTNRVVELGTRIEL